MAPEALALGAALCFALAKIAVKLATQTGNVLLGFVISLGTGTLAVAILAVLTVESWSVPLLPVVIFALAGLAGPGAGRILSMRAVRDAGASVAVPVQSSTNPLLSSLAGVVLFAETMGLGRLLALALIVSGVWSCARGGSANRGEAGWELHATHRPIVGRLLVLLLPLSAGAAHSAADVLKKFALAEHGDPIVGAFIGLMTAFTIWFTVFVATPQLREPVRLSPSFAWFGLAGLLSASAQMFLFFALRTGDLSVVAPIVASQPVIVILVSALVLRSVEQLRPGTIAGAVMVFFGAAYLALA